VNDGNGAFVATTYFVRWHPDTLVPILLFRQIDNEDGVTHTLWSGSGWDPTQRLVLYLIDAEVYIDQVPAAEARLYFPDAFAA
jgi:hypothetical protein